MLRILAFSIAIGALLSPASTRADWWTEGQAEWARHGFKHGRWDCYGKCPPEFQRHRRHRHDRR
ncbi:hypothetical protein [Methylocystis sp. S23]|jgi:hypothetical protein